VDPSMQATHLQPNIHNTKTVAQYNRSIRARLVSCWKAYLRMFLRHPARRPGVPAQPRAVLSPDVMLMKDATNLGSGRRLREGLSGDWPEIERDALVLGGGCAPLARLRFARRRSVVAIGFELSGDCPEMDSVVAIGFELSHHRGVHCATAEARAWHRGSRRAPTDRSRHRALGA
jgi:hypothetical protein